MQLLKFLDADLRRSERTDFQNGISRQAKLKCAFDHWVLTVITSSSDRLTWLIHDETNLLLRRGGEILMGAQGV